MSIEQSLRKLSQVSSHQFPDRSAKGLLRQREHLKALLEMLLGSLVEAFDFGRVAQLNRSFIPDELQTQESDMVFSLPFRTPQPRQEVIIYLLIEHQSTVDRSMGLRLLSYMVQIWMEARRRWIEETKQPEAEWQVAPIIPIPEATETLIKASVAENTLKAYQRALQGLTTWLSGRTLSDALLANYITALYEIGDTTQRLKAWASVSSQLRSHQRFERLTVAPPAGYYSVSAALTKLRSNGFIAHCYAGTPACKIFIAAFTSLSCGNPHSRHVHCLSESVRFSL